MSYFSDLAVKEIEAGDRDKSYPAPEVQLRWKLEDFIQKALSYGMTLIEIKSLFDVPVEPVLAADNELLYSYNSSYSPTLVMRCIKIVLAKLSKYGSIAGETQRIDQNIMIIFGMHFFIAELIKRRDMIYRMSLIRA